MARPTTPATRVRGERATLPAAAADALADLREDVGEHEHQQQRLHDRAHDEQQRVLAQHVQVALQQGDERARGRRPRRAQLARPSAGGDGAASSAVVASFAQVLPGEVDEDGLERRLGDREVGHRRRRAASAASMMRGSRPRPRRRQRTVPSTTLASVAPVDAGDEVRRPSRVEVAGGRDAARCVSAPIDCLQARPGCRGRGCGRGP